MIVCLANSRKPHGRCIAGREVLKNGYGGWIRPVSARSSAEISLEELRYENGREPQILDVITIPMIAAAPRVHQTENHDRRSAILDQRNRSDGGRSSFAR